MGRPPAPEPHVDAPTKSVVDFVLRTRKPAPKKDARRLRQLRTHD